MDALASAGHRYRVVPDVAQDVPYEHCSPGTLSQAHSRTGIKIKDQTIRIVRRSVRPEAPLRHVDFEGGQLCQPGKSRKIIDYWIVVVVIFVRDRPALHPVRRACAQILVEEDGRPLSLHLADAIRPPFPRRRTITQMRQHSWTDLRVVGQNIGLGGLGLGIEHFLEVAELDRPTPDGHHLVMRRLAHEPSIDFSPGAKNPRSPGFRSVGVGSTSA
jgi:hypothetical protein